MDTLVTEIAPGIRQRTTVLPNLPVALDQCLTTGDEPTLLHAGKRSVFPLASVVASLLHP